MIRLALCSVGEFFGGVERQLLDLCVYARRLQGAWPLLILFHDLELGEQARALGVRPVILQGRHRYDPALVGELARTLAESSTNVVHAHGYKAMIACALVRRRGAPGFAVVKTEHGRMEPAGADWIGWGKSWLNHNLADWATRRAEAAVTYVTEDIARHYERAHQGLRRLVIRNGIDPLDRSSFARPPELEPGLLHLGIVGRVTPVKGISFALRAIASEQVPGSVRLNIIGSGPQEASLRREAAGLGVESLVRFLGFRRNVLDFLAHLDGLLMPSLHEGLPYTLLEAMSLANPIVASRVGGLAEVLRHGETALLVPVGDVRALHAAIIRIVSDRLFARSLGLAAAAAQRRAFTLETMGAMYWRLYLECAAAKGVL